MNSWQIFNSEDCEVVYRPSLDGGGRTFGQEFFDLFDEKDYRPRGNVLEWCCGPAFIGFGINARFKISKLVLHDVNPLVADCVKRTTKRNGLKNVDFYCSTSISRIPVQIFDLIVANPPHFSNRKHYSNPSVEDQIIYDFGWEAHRLFFQEIPNYMNGHSLVILQENNRGSTAEDFRHFLNDSNLELLESIGDKGILTASDNFYFLLIGKRQTK